MSLNISLPSTAIAELESYTGFNAAGTSLKNVATSIWFTSTYVDVSDYVKAISIDGSINNLSGDPGANSATITLDNVSKIFSDLNAAGTYYGYLNPGKDVKIDLTVSGSTVTIFAGKVDESGFQEGRTGHQGNVTVRINDRVDTFSKKKFDKDYYYTNKNLVDITSTANSLLHILLTTHGGMQLSQIVCNGSVSILVGYTSFKEGESVQYRLQELAKACLAQYAGCRADGKYVMESRMVTGWSVPSSEYTLTASNFEVDVEKRLIPLLGNNVKIRGDQVDYYDVDQTLWKLSKVYPVGANSVFPNYCWAAVADNAYFLGDPTATPPVEFWAQYEVGVGEVIHVQSCVMSQTIYEGPSEVLTTAGTDLVAKETQGKLILQNLTGALVHVMDIQIRGKAAVRRTIHNRFQDQAALKNYIRDNGLSDDDAQWSLIAMESNASSISAYGQKDFVLSSEYLVNYSQMISVLDWWLKYGKDPKHEFNIGGLPFLAFMQPGAPITLNLTDLGYNGAVQVQGFSHHITPDAARTALTLDEVPGDWVVSSAAAVRIVSTGSSGIPVNPGSGQFYTVGASDWTGECDSKCDLLNDESDINAAILFVNTQFGGGIVQLTPGTFKLLSSAVNILSNVKLKGAGPGTIIDCSSLASSVLSFSSIGTSTIHNIGCGIENLTILNPKEIYFTYSDNSVIGNLCLQGPFYSPSNSIITADYSDALIINNNIIDGQGIISNSNGGIAVGNVTRTQIINNVLKGFRTSSAICVSIYAFSSGIPIQIIGNTLFDFSSTTGSTYGIEISGSYGIISNNRIEQMKNSGNAANVRAIYVQGTSNSIIDNYCYNNGSDAGIANTNGCQFEDAGTDTQYAG